MNVHHLKCWPDYFDAVKRDIKRFEIRKDDRPFEVGDVLVLSEWIPQFSAPDGHYTGRQLVVHVTYCLRDAESFGLMPGFVCMGIRRRGAA